MLGINTIENNVVSTAKQVKTWHPRYRPIRGAGGWAELAKMVKGLKMLYCGQEPVPATRFNVDGSHCLMGGGDQTLKLWIPAADVHRPQLGGAGSLALLIWLFIW